MKDTNFTRQERTIMAWLKLCTGTFLFFGIAYAFIPFTLLKYINGLGLAFLGIVSASAGGIPSTEHVFSFWWAQSMGASAVVVYAAFQAQSDWLRHYALTPVIVVVKIFSAGFLIYLLLTQPLQFYNIAFALADGAVGLVTWIYYVKARQSRT